MSLNEQVRMPVLLKLAEQAMSDLEFRAAARSDLEGALREFGYDLNEKERTLVLRFRTALEDAGIDLFLTEQFSMEDIELLRGLGEDLLDEADSGSRSQPS